MVTNCMWVKVWVISVPIFSLGACLAQFYISSTCQVRCNGENLMVLDSFGLLVTAFTIIYLLLISSSVWYTRCH